jgi:hypothetical protein
MSEKKEKQIGWSEFVAYARYNFNARTTVPS